MTTRFHNPVMTSERRRMREMFAAGMTRREIAKATGRHENTVSCHVSEAASATVWRLDRRHRGTEAKRIERLFAACNRALALPPHVSRLPA